MEIPDVEEAVKSAADASGLKTLVTSVSVEAALDEFEEEFLRVVVHIRPSPENIEDKLEAMVERVENVVLAADDRYPSVRFAEAA